MKAPFDVILFDIGGVLLTNGWDHTDRARVAGEFGMDAGELERRHLAPYRLWERGAVGVDHYLEAAVFHTEREFTRQDFFKAICAGSKLLEDGAMGILDALRASDRYTVGGLNNEPRETNAWRLDRYGLRERFDLMLSSCYLGLRKPDPEFFERSLEILARPAGRVLFIDDRDENVLAARSLGIHALRYDGSATLRRELEMLQVL